jgi:hypothetical protein
MDTKSTVPTITPITVMVARSIIFTSEEAADDGRANYKNLIECQQKPEFLAFMQRIGHDIKTF